jgi:hypothetical protein
MQFVTECLMQSTAMGLVMALVAVICLAVMP